MRQGVSDHGHRLRDGDWHGGEHLVDALLRLLNRADHDSGVGVAGLGPFDELSDVHIERAGDLVHQNWRVLGERSELVAAKTVRGQSLRQLLRRRRRFLCCRPGDGERFRHGLGDADEIELGLAQLPRHRSQAGVENPHGLERLPGGLGGLIERFERVGHVGGPIGVDPDAGVERRHRIDHLNDGTDGQCAKEGGDNEAGVQEGVAEPSNGEVEAVQGPAESAHAGQSAEDPADPAATAGSGRRPGRSCRSARSSRLFADPLLGHPALELERLLRLLTSGALRSLPFGGDTTLGRSFLGRTLPRHPHLELCCLLRRGGLGPFGRDRLTDPLLGHSAAELKGLRGGLPLSGL